MVSTISLSAVNRRAYSSKNVVSYYGSFNQLFNAERILLKSLESEISGSKILEIGVGGGRTTQALLDISPDYTGLDYAPGAVELAAARYPQARIRLGDARNLTEFPDNTFDFVLFSFNGLDALSDRDRLKALNEINRIMKPGSAFMFSSHNREYRYFRKMPWHRTFEFNAEFLKFFLYSLYHFPKHLRMRKHEVFTETYSMVNDIDHRYSLLLYYIDIHNQGKQLAKTGFSQVNAYDIAGNKVTRDDSSPWIYYLARKDQKCTLNLMAPALLTIALLAIMFFFLV